MSLKLGRHLALSWVPPGQLKERFDMKVKITVVSDIRKPKRSIKIEGHFDQYNPSAMRRCVTRVVSKLLRKNLPGHVSIQKTTNGVKECIATVSVGIPKYE